MLEKLIVRVKKKVGRWGPRSVRVLFWGILGALLMRGAMIAMVLLTK